MLHIAGIKINLIFVGDNSMLKEPEPEGGEPLLGRERERERERDDENNNIDEETMVRRPSSCWRKSSGSGGGGGRIRVVYRRTASHAGDELQSFRSCLRYLCLDQSTPGLTILSWALFLLLTYVAPVLSHFFLACPTCDSAHRRPFDSIVQLSLTVISTVSFLCLSTFVKRYGLRRFLFLDKLCRESEKVRLGYIAQLNRSFRLLSIFVLPCLVAESAYKVWWYSSGASRIPFLGNVFVSDAAACLMELSSWLYRTSIFFLVCVLFRIICYLQILRLQDFALVFHEESDVASILKEHLRIRRQLRIISHRFRAFILSTLLFVTASQLASLLTTTSSRSELNIFKAGELALCSIGLVTGLFICLRSSTKITHKAQAITALASKWHVCATIDAFEPEHGETDCETPTQQLGRRNIPVEVDSEDEGVLDEEDEVDGLKFIPPHAITVSFQKRQALVNYLENNRAGISVFGFMLDRSSLHTIFCIELSLVLWLLGKTIGIS